MSTDFRRREFKSLDSLLIVISSVASSRKLARLRLDTSSRWNTCAHNCLASEATGASATMTVIFINPCKKDTYGNPCCPFSLAATLRWKRPDVAILALEPDPARAATIRHIVGDVLRAELRIVGSKDELLEELGNGIPDVMLVPALLTSADETELLTHLSTLHESGHVEILVTPFRFASENQPRAVRRSWRTWWRKGQSTPEVYACDPRGFAEQLGWSLQRAQQVRQERGEASPPASSVIIPEVVTTADGPTLAPVHRSDRRAHRRFAADELHGLRSARIKYGPSVRLVDCSVGGALIESEIPLKPESEAMLEVIGDSHRSTVPFRVVRCHVSTVESRVVYWGACAFTQPLKLADLLQRRSKNLTNSKDERADRFDIALRSIVERHVSHADRDGQTLASARASQTPELSALLQGAQPFATHRSRRTVDQESARDCHYGITTR